MARFEIDFLDEYSDDALLNELRRIAALLSPSQPLTRRAFKENSPKVSHSTIIKRFGGWREALEKAGLSHLYDGPAVSQKMRSQIGRRLSEQELVAELKRVYALVGKEWLTWKDFSRHSIVSGKSITNRFGTFRKGIEAAGITPAPYSSFKSTDEQCFENLAAVWTHYGRRPTASEMLRPPSTIQPYTYERRWGTWRKALKMFVEWANAAGGPQERKNAKRDVETNSTPVDAKPNRTEADRRDVRPGLRFRVFMRDRFCCVSCGRSPATHLGLVLHADHIVAVANGGKTTLENLQTLCQDCNLGKGRTVIPSFGDQNIDAQN